MDKESRNAFVTLGAVLVALLAIGLIFSGRSGDAIYTGPPIHAQYQHAEVPEATEPPAEETAQAPAEDAPAEEVAAEDVPAEEAEGEVAEAEAPAAEEAPAEELPAEVAEEPAPTEAPAEEVAEAPADEAPAEEAPAEEAPVAEAPTDEAPAAEEAPDEAAVQIAGDPAAGERVFRQCQACHQIGEGAQNRVGPHLIDIIDRPKAAVEGFNYSAALESRGVEGGVWSVEELRGFLANPRDYLPGTSMAYAGVRAEGDLEDLIAYLASYE